MKNSSFEKQVSSKFGHPTEAVAVIVFLEEIASTIKDEYDSLGTNQRMNLRVNGIDIDLDKGVATIHYNISESD